MEGSRFVPSEVYADGDVPIKAASTLSFAGAIIKHHAFPSMGPLPSTSFFTVDSFYTVHSHLL